MSELSGVRFEVEAAVGTITLARPEVSNSVDLDTATAFGAAVDRAAADDAVRVVVLRGDGPRFCAGGDAAWISSAGDTHAALLELAGVFDGALQRLGRIPKPVVAAVQGAAAGAGLGVVLAADLVVSTRTARYLTAYAGIGLTPDCGVSWLLPRAVGQQRALELALTGRILSAEEAQAWGIVTTVVDDDGLDDAMAELTARLTAASPFALGQARRLIRSSFDQSRVDSGQDESESIAAASLTDEARASISKFVKK
ncbi:enoyl-CoA hydratase/isomerase family protein [Streptomyces sp. NPDC002623]